MLPKITLPPLKEMFAVLTALQVEVIGGITMGFSSYLLPQLMEINEEITLSPWMIHLIGSSSVTLKIVGCLIDLIVSDILGRRRVLQICYGCLIVCWIIISCSFNGLMLLIARLFTSIFSGMVVSSMVYLVEVAGDGARSNYLCLFPASVTVGTEIAYVLVDLLHWRIVGLIFSVYSVVIFICARVVPESPYWYVAQNNLDEAYKSLKWLGRLKSKAEIDARLDEMRRNNSASSKLSTKQKFRLICERNNAKKLAPICSLLILLSLTGYLSVNNWSVQLFEAIQANFDSKTLGLILGTLVFVCNITLIILIDRVAERKRLIVIAYSGLAITGFVLLICRYIEQNYDDDKSSTIVTYISTLGIYVYSVFLYSGAGSPLWATLADVAPTVIRTSVIGTMVIASTITVAIVIHLLPYFIYGHRMIGLFLSATIVSTAAVIIAWVFLPKRGDRPIELYKMDRDCEIFTTERTKI